MKPASINIIPCPRENKNSIIIECVILAEIDANAIILANIGVEHGVPISAKAPPSKIGYKNSLLKLFFGISLITVGS